MKKNTLDQLFQKAAESHTQSPSAEAWSKIATRIQPENKKKRVFWPRIAIVASLILISMGVWFNFKTTPKLENNNAIATKKTILPQKAQNTTTKKTELNTQIQESFATINLDLIDNKKPKNKANNPLKLKKKLSKPLNIFNNNHGSLRSIDIVAQNNIDSPKPINNVKVNEIPAIVVAVNTPEQKTVPQNTNLENESFTLLVKMGATQTAMLEPTETPMESTEQEGFLKKVWKQYKNVKEGEPVKWKTFGIKPNKILAKAEGKVKGYR